MSQDLKDRALEYIQTYSVDMQQLQLQREKALKQYMCEPYGNEEDGRSSVVTSDIFDTVETIMPYLMRLFYGGQEVAKFSGAGEGDEAGSELLGELVNWFVQKKMGGFILFHDWIKECLIHRLSVVKYWYEKREEYKDKYYENLTAQELAALGEMTNHKIEKVEEFLVNEEIRDEYGNVVEPAGYGYNVTAKKITRISQPMAEALPAEEFLFDVKAKCISDSPCGHKKRMHKSELMQKYKVSEDDLVQETANFTTDPVYVERFQDLGGISFLRDGDTDFYYIYEMYLDEYDKKGNAKAMKIVMLGSKEIAREVNSYGEPPFIDLSPIRLPHRAVGLGIAQILEDIQRIHTAIMRAILDNIYFQNNGREAFDPSAIDVDTLIDSNRPGGKVPVKPGKDPRAVLFPLPVVPLAPQTYEMLKTISENKQDRSGVNRYVQGDDKGLNKTAFGVNTLLNQAMQRQELLARILAETGFQKFFRKMAELTIEYMDQPQAVRLNGKWKTISPNDIDVDFDVNIDVGLGTGSKDVTVQQMLQMLGISLNQILLAGGIVTPENVHNILKTIYENMGHKSVEQFVTDPHTRGLNVGTPMGAPGIPQASGGGIGMPQAGGQGVTIPPAGGGIPQFYPNGPLPAA